MSHGAERLHVTLDLNDLLLVDDDKVLMRGPSELSFGIFKAEDDLRIETIGTILLLLRNNNRGDSEVEVIVRLLSEVSSTGLNVTVNLR